MEKKQKGWNHLFIHSMILERLFAERSYPIYDNVGNRKKRSLKDDRKLENLSVCWKSLVLLIRSTYLSIDNYIL